MMIFAFHCNYGSNLHHFRDKANYWSKIAIFHIPLHSAPPLGSPHRNIVITFGTKNYQVVKKSLRICSTVLIQHWRVTDGRTDG